MCETEIKRTSTDKRVVKEDLKCNSSASQDVNYFPAADEYIKLAATSEHSALLGERVCTLEPYRPANKKFTLQSRRLAYSVLLILIVSLLIANIATGDSRYPRAINVLWFALAVISILYPVRLLINNAINLCFTANRKVCLNIPINTSCYRNYSSQHKKKVHSNVTIIIPVYTEDFEVIRTTIDTASKEAISVSGRVNIIVCDDGLMSFSVNSVLPEFYQEALATPEQNRSTDQNEVIKRISFYKNLVFSKEINFAYVARPFPKKGVAVTRRNGTFKKGSNLNFTHKICDFLKNKTIDEAAIQSALKKLLGEHYNLAYADGDLQIGEYIVLLDKDSSLPSGVIQDVLPDFYEDESLSFCQFATTSYNSTENTFSKFTAYFYDQEFSMRYAMEAINGSVSFVGHNAFIRTEHLKKLGYWNEEHVSEDLSLNMELTALGYHGKFIDLSHLRFGEMVPSSITEEAQRYSRYAYGAAQIIVNPMNMWLKKGILASSFKHYLASKYLPWYCKADVFLHLTTFLGMLLLFPAMLLSTAYPNIVLQLHLTNIAVFFAANFIRVFPGLYQNSDIGNAQKTFWTRTFKYLIQTIPKIISDLMVFYMVLIGYIGYIVGRKPDHPPTSVDKYQEQKIILAFTRANFLFKTMLPFIVLFLAAELLVVLGGFREFTFYSYHYLVFILTIFSPYLLMPELKNILLVQPKIYLKCL